MKHAGLQQWPGVDRHHRHRPTRRMEVLALPLVAVVLFFVFGGVIAAGHQ